MEGTLCYNPPTGCNETGLELPIWNYTHTVGNAVIGGYVYHGTSLPSLAGLYIYGDWGSGRIWTLRYNNNSNTVNTEIVNTGLNIASFGLDQHGELYFTAYNGKIYKLTAASIPEYPLQTGLPLILSAIPLLAFMLKNRKNLRHQIHVRK